MQTRKSFWPLGIVAAFVSFIAGTIALIVIACTHKTDLITADYYADELKFQGRLDQLNRTAQHSEQVVVSFDATRQSIVLALPPATVNAQTTGRIQLYRPSATDRDVVVRLELDAAGSQVIDAATLLPGLWKVRVQWTAQGQDYFADKNIVVKRGA